MTATCKSARKPGTSLTALLNQVQNVLCLHAADKCFTCKGVYKRLSVLVKRLQSSEPVDAVMKDYGVRFVKGKR